jgi:hypothetical protein
MTFSHPARLVAAPFLILALAACDGGGFSDGFASMSQGLEQPLGSNDYQREMRAREGARRSSVPYSVPPETRAPMTGGGPVAGGPLPLGPLTTAPQAQPFVPAPGPVGQADATLPAGVAPQTFTPIPFGSRPAGAEIAPTANTEIVTVTSVPTGAATSGPNVMAYALQTRHSVGTAMYRRSNPFRWSRWEGACLQFANQDLAQEAFLAAGGPDRDPQHLDPDGDGFACWWDPQVYRQAVALGQ